MSETRTIYVTANSPGEISGFLVPVVASLRRQFDGARIVVILLPCTFATGREEAVARSVPGVDEVLPARRIWPMVLRGLPYKGELLVHLGGDLLYAALLARRWKLPTWAFQWANPRWDPWMRGYFVKTEADAARMRQQGIAPERITVIGDLVVDSVHQALGIDRVPAMRDAADAPHIAFLPGSRREEAVMLSRFFLETAEHVRAVMPHARFSLLLSPFLDWGAVRGALQGTIDPLVGGVRGTLARNDGQWRLVSAAGTVLELVADEPLKTLASADFAVSIPGTKTAEAASLGKPMLVVLPINRLEAIPWHGLLGMLDWLPLLGRWLKRAILRTMVDRYIGRVYSQPNLMSDTAVVPELVGFLSPMLVADKILEVFGRRPLGRGPLPLRGRVESALGPYSCNGAAESDHARMRADLETLYGPFHGAADRAVSRMAAAEAPVLSETH